jgi:predicted acetyltransferase
MKNTSNHCEILRKRAMSKALSYIPYTRDQTQADVKRLVTLDRIAQCFQDK